MFFSSFVNLHNKGFPLPYKMMKGLVQFVLDELFELSLQYYEARKFEELVKPHFWLVVIMMVILILD